jgi:hypothetical protein
MAVSLSVSLSWGVINFKRKFCTASVEQVQAIYDLEVDKGKLTLWGASDWRKHSNRKINDFFFASISRVRDPES